MVSLFKLKENKTSIRTEMIAGFSTFLTMSYVIFINPALLALTGMDQGAVFVATCLAAAIGSALMGILANYPIALAPGMALNAYFTYGVVLGSGYSWQIALGAVFLAGILFLLLSILPIRAYIIDGIPKSLKVAIVAGVGFFLCMIGFKNAGLMIPHEATLVALGDLHQPTTLLAILGFFIIVSLDALGITSAIIIGILSITALSMILGYVKFNGIFSMPPSIASTFMQMDLIGAFNLNMITIIFAFLFVEFFDNTGTLIGIAYRANLIEKSGRIPRLKQALIADSSAAIVGAVIGTSTTTSYLESIIGVKVGGRTGLTAIVVAFLFLLSIFMSPLAHSIPNYATAPALIYVACLMMRAFTEINWDDATEYSPAVITAITMPFTFSVADGISFGFISYVVIKLLSGRIREVNSAMLFLTLIFILKYIFIKS